MKRVRWIELRCEKCFQRVRLPARDVKILADLFGEGTRDPQLGAPVLIDDEPATCPSYHGGNTYFLAPVRE